MLSYLSVFNTDIYLWFVLILQEEGFYFQNLTVAPSSPFFFLNEKFSLGYPVAAVGTFVLQQGVMVSGFVFLF